MQMDGHNWFLGARRKSSAFDLYNSNLEQVKRHYDLLSFHNFVSYSCFPEPDPPAMPMIVVAFISQFPFSSCCLDISGDPL